MVGYDSATKRLVFHRRANDNGNTVLTIPEYIDLSNTTEDARQLAIRVAKASVRYANGNKLFPENKEKKVPQPSTPTNETVSQPASS